MLITDKIKSTINGISKFFANVSSSLTTSYNYLFPNLWPSSVYTTDEQILSIPALQRALHIVANSVAMMPCEVTQFFDDGTVSVERRHALYNLLRYKPNESCSSFNFFYSWVWQTMFYGNGYAIIHFDDDGYRPIALSVVDQSVFQVDVYDVNESDIRKPPKLFYVIDGQAFPSREILHLRGFSKNGLVGISNSDLNRANYKLPLSARRMGEKFYEKGSFLSGYLKFPQALKPDAYTRLEDSWKKAFSGVENAGGTPIIEQGGEFVKVQISPKEASMLETQSFSISEISRITGVPPHLLYQLDMAKFDTVEQLGIEFSTYTVVPWVTQIEIEVGNKAFLPSERTHTRKRASHFGVNFDTTALLRADAESRGSFYQSGIQNGWLKPNEARKMEGFSPVPGGEKTYMQMQMQPLENIPSPQEGQGQNK